MAAAETGEHAIFWRDSALGGLELLRAHYVTHSFAPHSHDTFAIGVVEAGVERFHYRHAPVSAPSGSLIIINPGEPHTGSSALADGWRYRMLYPDPSLLREAAGALTGRARPIPFFADPVVHDPLLARELLRLHSALEGGAELLERQSRLLEFLARLIQRHADTPHLDAPLTREPLLVRRLRDYLDEHANAPVTLAELAALAGMSEFHTLRVFTRATGMPPHAYLTQRRVAHARTLLAHRLPLAQVAAFAGFYDQSHLTRHFKRIVGVTPGQYAHGAPSP
ncbi:MAG TPA: AraC family transcriptional regulator [Ktedonobacterales bacterium]|nr:AraC family transcriptional regulator [Ktedonobacterales bacterium]